MAVRLAPDGAIDPSFGDDGVVVVGEAGVFHTVVALPDGEIVAGGAAAVADEAASSPTR